MASQLAACHGVLLACAIDFRNVRAQSINLSATGLMLRCPGVTMPTGLGWIESCIGKALNPYREPLTCTVEDSATAQ
jgi:hypothetical protein